MESPPPFDSLKPENLDAILEGNPASCLGFIPDLWLLVDTTFQTLWILRGRQVEASYHVSTSDKGLDNRDGSGGTPPGVHVVAQKIGQDAAIGTIFSSREPTGETWRPDWNEDPTRAAHDLILTRILVLDGCEEGTNRGPGIDSRERYIYIHGTNREDLLGKAVSRGCIRMSNTDIIDLHDRVEEGTPLVII